MILSIVLSVLLFLLLKVLFNLGFIISALSSLLFYIGFNLILTKDEKTLVIDANKSSLTKGLKTIDKISEYESLIDKKEIKQNIRDICKLSTDIINVAKEKNKETSVKKFINYYLPFTLKILNEYNDLEDKKLSSRESKKFMSNVEALTEKIKSACEKTLNSLYEGDMLNTNAEIKVFEGMLKSDNLVDDNMNIKIGSGKNE